MIREEYLRRLVDSAYADLYLSAVDGARIYWPWRMQPVHEASKRHRNACESYIVDSSFKDPSITNEDALDTAHALDAEMVVLADVWHDCEATIEAIRDGLDRYDDHPYDGKVLAPLQPPHDECYAALAGDSIDAYAIGGVKDSPDAKKIAGARAVRDCAGEDVWIHGLGFGVTPDLVEAVREDPGLLDSLDYSTPVQNATRTDTAPGKERMSVVAARAAAQLVEDLRLVSPFAEDPTAEDLRESGQASLEELA